MKYKLLIYLITYLRIYFIPSFLPCVDVERPTLVQSSAEKVSRIGDTVMFECLSRGGTTTTQLTVHWLKDGQPVITAAAAGTPKSRHFLVADSQILVLTDARRADSGEYTCVVSNAAGSRRAVSTLRVTNDDDPSVPTPADSGGTLTARLGLVVIATVCGVVLTSLAWVMVIYWLHRRRDFTGDSSSSTSTDESVIPVTSTSLPGAGQRDVDCLQYRVHLTTGISGANYSY